jgi:hypothetical protein
LWSALPKCRGTTLQNTAEPDPETELAKCRHCRALGASARTRVMPGRTRGDAAVRRVVERLFALTVDDEADAGLASTSGDAGPGAYPRLGRAGRVGTTWRFAISPTTAALG